MPASVPLIPVLTDPDTWDAAARNHLMQRAEERKAPPELWTAIKNWGNQRPYARPDEPWYKEWSYPRSLIGWKLVGKGRMPTSVLSPAEGKYIQGRKLASDVDGWLDSPLADR